MISLQRYTFPPRGLGRNVASIAYRKYMTGAAVPAFAINIASVATLAPASSCQRRRMGSSLFANGCRPRSTLDNRGVDIPTEMTSRQKSNMLALQSPLYYNPWDQHKDNSKSALTIRVQTRCLSQYDHPGTRCSGMKSMRDCRTIEEIALMARDNLDVMTSRDVAAFWSAAPKLLNARIRSKEMDAAVSQHLEVILVHTLENMSVGKFGARDLAQTANGMAKVVKSLDVGRRLRRPFYKVHDLFIGNNAERRNFIFRSVEAATMPVIQQFDARCLSNLIYAYSIATYAPQFEDGRKLFAVLATEVLPKLQELNPQGLSNIIWAYAKMKATNPALFDGIGDTIVSSGNLSDFEPQALSNIIWAYAHMGHSHPELFEAVAGHVAELGNSLHKFQPQAISNVVWSYATLDETHPKLFKELADHIVKLDSLGKFYPQALSNIVWSYATLNESHPMLFNKVSDHIAARDNWVTYTNQALSNIMWAYATADESHPALFTKIASHIITRNLNNFSPQALSNIVWACATANESQPKLLDSIAKHIASLDSLDSFLPQALSNIVWSYATLKEPHPRLFDKISDAAILKQDKFNPQNTASLLWAYASNGQVNQHLFQSMASLIATRLKTYNRRDLTNILWAFAVANVDVPSLSNDSFIDIYMEKEDEFSHEDLCQLHQWQLWQDELKSNIRLPPSLEEKCYDAFVSRVPIPSALQNDVISKLSSIGLQPIEEVLTDRGYYMDALVEVDGNKLGIEVDGPSHFLARNPTGSTSLKRRQITDLEGIPIVSVPYWEWDAFGNEDSEKEAYLRSLIGVI